MTDAEFDVIVREAQRRLADDMRDARRERRNGHTVVTVRYENGNPVRPLSVEPKRNFDVKP